jgi:tRNA pseudouridine32 synthase/23S rRNA pseudouridine746 synthase
MSPEEMGNRLLYRDGLMLIIDKPAGLAVHKGPKDHPGGASIEDYFDALRFGLPRMPALAHRLDKETSGCLVLGRHRKALADLNLLFRNGKVGKTYWAVVEGGPERRRVRSTCRSGRLDDTRGWWMKHDPAGLPSQTTWTVMGRGNGLTWLALEPLTGRNAPVAGALLGDRASRSSATTSTAARRVHAPGMHLHAREIVVPLYRNKPPIKVTAPVPAHMKERLQACGWTEAMDSAITAPLGLSRPQKRQ